MPEEKEDKKSCYNCGHLKCIYNNNPIGKNPICLSWEAKGKGE